jgi:multidrug efflux pump subunit AcrB
LFGLVLSIGLLVDDAIVVVENVERVMEEEPGISPREATIKSMAEINTSRWSRSRWCSRPCSCRWPSSADRPA